VAAVGQAGQSARVTRAGLRLVHRGLWHCRPPGGQGVAWRTERL